MARGSQLIRQWRLFQRLGHTGGVTIAAAARELHCSVRTAWRDLTVLPDAGFPLDSDPRADGHRDVRRIEPNFQLHLPLPLTLSELVALLMSRQGLAAMSPGTLSPPIGSVIDKISGLHGRDAVAQLKHPAFPRAALSAPARVSTAERAGPAGAHSDTRSHIRYTSQRSDDENRERARGPEEIREHPRLGG